jgi:hypothetical protein
LKADWVLGDALTSISSISEGQSRAASPEGSLQKHALSIGLERNYFIDAVL